MGSISTLINRPLSIGSTFDYSPFSFFKSKNQASGFDLDLISDLLQRSGLPYRYVPLTWQQIGQRPPQELPDIIVGGITDTNQRRKTGYFISTHIRNKAVVAAKNHAVLKGFADHSALTLGVNEGGYLESLARRQFKHLNILTTKFNPGLAKMLDQGKCDFILSDAIEINSFSKEHELAAMPLNDAQNHGVYIPKKGEHSKCLRRVLQSVSQTQSHRSFHQHCLKKYKLVDFFQVEA